MSLEQASAFIVTYPVNNALDKEGNGTGKAVAWEKAFIQLAQVFFFSPNDNLKEPFSLFCVGHGLSTLLAPIDTIMSEVML